MVGASDKGAAARRKQIADDTVRLARAHAAALIWRHREIMAATAASHPDLAQIDLMREAAHCFVGLCYAERVEREGPPKI